MFGVAVGELGLGGFDEAEGVFVPADDGGAAAVALERAQLREKPRREQAGVAAMAVVGRADGCCRQSCTMRRTVSCRRSGWSATI